MKLERIAPVLAALLLGGCGDGGVGEIQDWMRQVEARTVPKVEPLPAPKQFVPQGYVPDEALDPFNLAKLSGDAAQAGLGKRNPYQPDVNRPKEVLENFPLDTMQMVGTLHKGGVSYALVQVERTLYHVRAGQRMGQNYGRIVRVTDGAIELREAVQDSNGDWTERMATLELQENKESGK
ncbi:pilus assembly protein PilP [Massilia sp. YIM B02443]|uniref:pilus assembly protein PilP n=1 Tax=Massilia sp. YIM B02443 TaxID=3050127 RepID=UPI0025B70A9B|nr:pilus assembly protein PilP [Massilia sp. YIM B02443]MDN4040093.1 pilus assembly protein PilP [Massilia sp. YIM B02443]